MSRSLTKIPKSRATRATPGGPPDDPNFFRTIRLVLQGQFTDPYSQHPWVYAGTQGIAGPLSQLPFRLYRVTGKPDAGDTAQRRRARRILEVAPTLGKKAAHSIASFADPRARAFELRRMAPWLRRLELVRAIGEVEPVEDGEWYRLFERPNPTLVPAQLWEATYVDLSTSGECFWILLGKTGDKCREDEIPSEIWPTQGGDRWEPVQDKRTKTPKAWKDKGEGIHSSEVVYPTGSYLQARYLNPRDPLRGLSPLEPIALEIKTDYRAQQFNLAFLENGAMAGGWFTTDKGMVEKDAAKWVKDFEARHGGPKKTGRPALLTHGVKFTPNQASFAEMQYQAGRATSRDNILSAGFKTTKNALGLSGDQNRASMLASLRNHWDSVLLPKSHYIEDLLAAQLFTPARNGGKEIFGLFDTSVVAALREDLTERLAAAEMMQALGWTANQINEALELGLPPLPWGDAWWPEFGRSPINAEPAAGQSGGGSAIEPEDESDAEDGEEEDEAEPAAEDGEEDDAEDEEGKAARRRLRLMPPGAVRRRARLRRARGVGGEGWDAIRRSVLGPGEDRHARRFKRFLYDLRKAQLERIREKGGKGGAEALAFDLSEWRAKVAAAMRETYRAIVAAAARKAEAEVAELGKKSKGAMVRASEETVDFIAEGLGRRIGRVVRTIRKQLVRVMAAAESEDPEELADEVRGAFNDLMLRGKLGVIARTETSAANNLAREAVFEEAGIEREEWLTADDELVRDTHVVYGEAAAQPRGTNWATLSGNSYTLRFPHDPQAPAAEVVNCRCVLIPVAS